MLIKQKQTDAPIQSPSTERERKSVVYNRVFDELEINIPKPFEGEWNERVKNIPNGDIFLEEIREFIDLPLIIDHLPDNQRREWRQWAFTQEKNGVDKFQGFRKKI